MVGKMLLISLYSKLIYTSKSVMSAYTKKFSSSHLGIFYLLILQKKEVMMTGQIFDR